MERLEREWEVYPVLHIDFSLTKYTELQDLTGQLNLFLHRWEEIYGKTASQRDAQVLQPSQRIGQYLRFLFLTGISKFSQLSIFSELNNLQNISMRDDFSALCGITEQELLTQLKTDIERMAAANGETYEEACAHLKHQYDGYHFSGNCPDIYNPFSLFNAFNSPVTGSVSMNLHPSVYAGSMVSVPPIFSA